MNLFKIAVVGKLLWLFRAHKELAYTLLRKALLRAMYARMRQFKATLKKLASHLDLIRSLDLIAS